MEHIIKQPLIIRLPHLGLIAMGIFLVILSLIVEPYISLNRTGVIVIAIAFGLLIVECTLFTVIIRSMITKKTRLRKLVKRK